MSNKYMYIVEYRKPIGKKTSYYSFFQRKFINSTFVQFCVRLLKQNIHNVYFSRAKGVGSTGGLVLNCYIRISKTFSTKSVNISEVVWFHEMVF